MQIFKIHGSEYSVERLLGKGKGGYSYLVRDEEQNPFTVKKIHHEKCDYYTFPEDKIGLELTHYDFLKRIGVKMPMMIDFDRDQEIILKEYIQGPTLMDLVISSQITVEQMMFMEKLQDLCTRNNINIDYFPTNFIVQNGDIFYVDYELNVYDERWNFDNWGRKYYSKDTPEIQEYIKSRKELAKEQQ
jgi:RIO-like serine/threonine protein kinase